MPLTTSINWRWSPLQVTNEPQQSMLRGFQSLGEGISQARERSYRRGQDARAAERQAEIDRMNAEDRQRRIDEDERQKRLYGETADLIRGKMAERQELVQRRKELQGRIDALKARLGG